MIIKEPIKKFALAAFALLLTACGENINTEETSAAQAAALAPIILDARRQDIYATNCAVCHGMAGTGAPLSGKLADWQQRSNKGMETMLNNAMDGYQSMPAMGGCFDCSEQDFRQLIGFMSSGTVK